MLILFEMEGSKLTSAFYFYSDYLFFIYFVLKDSLPIRAEACFFALNQPRGWLLQGPEHWRCNEVKRNGKEKQRSDLTHCKTFKNRSVACSLNVEAFNNKSIPPNGEHFSCIMLISVAHCGGRRAAVLGKGNNFYLDGLSALTPFPRTISCVLRVFNFFRDQNADNLFSPVLLCIPGWLLLPSRCRRPTSSLLCSTPEFPGALPWLLDIAGLLFPGQRR